MANRKDQNVGLEKVSALERLLRSARLTLKLMGDRRVRFAHKLLPIAGVLYVLLPIDFLPDVLPIIGQVDDAAIIGACVWLFLKAVPKELVLEHLVRLGYVQPPPNQEPASPRSTNAAPPKREQSASPAPKADDVVDAEYRVVSPDEGQAPSRRRTYRGRGFVTWSENDSTESER